MLPEHALETVSGSGFRVSDYGFRVSGFWFRVWERTKNQVLGVPGSGTQVSGFGSGVFGGSGFKPGKERGVGQLVRRVWSFGFWVPGFGSRIPGFG